MKKQEKHGKLNRWNLVSLAQRSRIVLLAFEGHTNEFIEREVGLHHDAVGLWRRRWRENWQRLISIECSEKPHVLEQEIQKLLADLPRAGRKPAMTSEQQAAVFKKACEDPKDSDRPIAKWTHGELSLQLIGDGVFDAISGRWIGKLLRRAAIRPHKKKYWLMSKDQTDPSFDQRVAEVCAAYRDAIELYQAKGIHVAASCGIEEDLGKKGVRGTSQVGCQSRNVPDRSKPSNSVFVHSASLLLVESN